MKDAISTLGVPAKAAKATAKPVQAKRVKRERTEELPRRASRRLQTKLLGEKDETPEEKQLREASEIHVPQSCFPNSIYRKKRLEKRNYEKRQKRRRDRRNAHDMMCSISGLSLKRTLLRSYPVSRLLWRQWHSRLNLDV